jgi:hypothetical protein
VRRCGRVLPLPIYVGGSRADEGSAGSLRRLHAATPPALEVIDVYDTDEQLRHQKEMVR